MLEKELYPTFMAFRPHFDAMQRVGYFKIVKKNYSDFKMRLYSIYRIVMSALIIAYNLQHFIQLYKVRHSTDKMVDILFVLLTTLNTMVKQIAFNVRSRRMDNLIRILDGPRFAPTKPEHSEIMKLNAIAMSRLLKLYQFAALICGLLWAMFPIVNRALAQEVEFTGYFPFNTDASPIFELTQAYMSILITFQAYGNVTMDCTICAFYAQSKIQLQMLRSNLEHLVDDEFGTKRTNERYNTNVYKDEDKIFGGVLKNRLANCVQHHIKVIWFLREVESIFDEAMTFQFMVMAWVICMTVYKIVSLSIFSAEFVSMAFYLGCMLAQLFIYCYFGTQVKVESEFLNQSLYFGNWFSLSPKFRRQLLVMMNRFSIPLHLRTAHILPMSLDTYIAVLKSSYTLFTFLDRK